MNQAGATLTNNYYYPYGGNRGGAFSNLTTKRFTGQYHESSLPGGEGLSYYNARWYDAKLGRFLSADTIVPGSNNPQALNRYSYVFNNPVRLIDPSGHGPCLSSGNGGATLCDNSGINGSGQWPRLPIARYWCSQDYSCFDRNHWNAPSAERLISLVRDRIITGSTAPIDIPMAPGVSKYGVNVKVTFVAWYTISPNATIDQADAIAYGIWEHWSYRFEAWEGNLPILGQQSSFAMEDQPTHHVSFVSAQNGWSPEQAFSYLGSMIGYDERPPQISTGERNYAMEPKVQDELGRWWQRTWPDPLRVSVIRSGPDTWSFVGTQSGFRLGFRGSGEFGGEGWLNPDDDYGQ